MPLKKGKSPKVISSNIRTEGEIMEAPGSRYFGIGHPVRDRGQHDRGRDHRRAGIVQSVVDREGV